MSRDSGRVNAGIPDISYPSSDIAVWGILNIQLFLAQENRTLFWGVESSPIGLTAEFSRIYSSSRQQFYYK